MTTIPASVFVKVTPNVLSTGGDALDLNGLILTDNTMVPIDDVHEFVDPNGVGNYFGFDSDEYAKAVIYFASFNGSLVKPGSLLLSQYPTAAVSAYLRGGDISDMLLVDLQALSGSLSVVMDGYIHAAVSVDLSSAMSFSDAASIIDTAINASEPTEASFTGSLSGTTLTVTAKASGTIAPGQTVSGATVAANTIILSQLTGAIGGIGTYHVSISQTVASESMTGVATAPVVSFDSISGAFVITSAITGVASTAAFATGTLAGPILLTAATGAVVSQGAVAAVPGTFMDGLVNVSQNWATFMTLFDPDESGFDEKLAFSAWANAQDDRYGYVCWDKDSGPSGTAPDTGCLGYAIAQAKYSGTVLIGAEDDTADLAEIAAFELAYGDSLSFSTEDGRTTAAYRKQTGLVASTSSKQAAANLLANGYNYYGAIATANDDFLWYVNGSVSGPFAWFDSFINQIWMNNAFQLALIELLQTVRSIPYNSKGYTTMEQALAPTINDALNFGAIRTGVPLSDDQSAATNTAAGVDVASTLSTSGWYLQILAASAEVRAKRGSPPAKFWYTDGESVQSINLDSVLIP